MRIIGGKYRGRKLKSFEGAAVRPTSDRAREALFNIFQFEMADAVFLDLFGGSGGIALEALSRRAKEAIIVDNAPTSIALINENLKLLGESAEVVLSDAIKYLKSTLKKFDFIFLDPPYAYENEAEALNVIAERKLLNKGGKVIYEKDKEIDFNCDALKKSAVKKYGKAIFTIFVENNG